MASGQEISCSLCARAAWALLGGKKGVDYLYQLLLLPTHCKSPCEEVQRPLLARASSSLNHDQAGNETSARAEENPEHQSLQHSWVQLSLSAAVVCALERV